MPRTLKIVIIGAGSKFTRGVLADIAASGELASYDLNIVLVDLDEGVLEQVVEIGQSIRDHYGSAMTIEATTDRARALPQADYVVLSVERRRNELWEQDFRVPLSFGFRHVLGENGGPGAMFHALRNYEIVLPVCRDMERLCPNATLLNFTNPEVRIVMAVTRLTQVKVIGLCHGVLNCRKRICELLDKTEDELHIETGGINHFFWVLKVRHVQTGQDLYPALRQRVLETASPLVKRLMNVFGLYTYPSDDHVGEYLSFAHEYTGLRWPYGLESHRVGETRDTRRDWRDEFLNGTWSENQKYETSEEIAIGIMEDIEGDKGSWRPAVNVPNTQGAVENLPPEAIVEVPATVDASGVHPVPVGKLPEPLAALTRTQISIQSLVVEAYRTRSRNLLLQALLLDPVVNSLERAETMLDVMLDLQKDYLPAFD